MTRARLRLLHLASLLLQPADREAVLGDLTESGATLFEAVSGILGLALRRQIGLWRNWQPWLALIGVAGVAGSFLSYSVFGLDLGIGEQIRTYVKYGVRYEMGVSGAQDVTSLAILVAAVCFWSWTSGFVLGSLSGRAAWLTGIFFYLAVCTSWYFRHLLFDQIRYSSGGYRAPIPLLLLSLIAPFTFVRICVLVCAVWGAIVGVRKHVLGSRRAVEMGVTGIVLIVLLLWTGGWYEAAKPGLSNGVWQPVSWTTRILPLLVMSWPVAYLVAESYKSRLGGGQQR